MYLISIPGLWVQTKQHLPRRPQALFDGTQTTGSIASQSRASSLIA